MDVSWNYTYDGKPDFSGKTRPNVTQSIINFKRNGPGLKPVFRIELLNCI
jgi:hypothetical protein